MISDRELIRLYGAYSEEWYCASWMSLDEHQAKDFADWLYKELMGGAPYERALTDYEAEGIPILRKVYAEVQERVWVDRPKG